MEIIMFSNDFKNKKFQSSNLKFFLKAIFIVVTYILNQLYMQQIFHLSLYEGTKQLLLLSIFSYFGYCFSAEGLPNSSQEMLPELATVKESTSPGFGFLK